MKEECLGIYANCLFCILDKEIDIDLDQSESERIYDGSSHSHELLDEVIEKSAIAPPVFVFQKDKAQKSLAEQKGLSDSGEDPQGEAESPHRAMGHPKSTRGATLRLLPPQLLVSELLPVLAG
ncbi:hypothetical protein Chor_017124 [Crotalus horridus]